MDTSRYLRFTQVDDVEETDRGLRAALHGEQLRLDVVRDDVVRVKISRGGVFDEQPTYAVCVDPLAAPVEFTVEREDGVVRVRTEKLVATLTLDPFRLDVHRPDGTVVAETAASYTTLNDAWAIRRRCRPDDAFYGLGERAGRHDRKGRAFTLWNTDVLNPTATAEFVAAHPPDDPRADVTSVEFDPYYVSIPFFYHHAQDGSMAASFVDNGYRAAYDFAGGADYAFHFEGGQYTEYLFAGPAIADILEAYTWLTGRTALPPLWSLGYHQCRWHTYTQDDVEALAQRHRAEGIPCDALWLDIEHMDGYRVFTWDRERFPDPEGMMARLARDGVRLVTIVDPGVKLETGYAAFDEGLARDVLCRTEGGDVYVGEVWPGETAFPDFATEEGRAWWGELNAAHVASGVAGIWNDMNEPATGVISPDGMRFDHGRIAHGRLHNQYALLMAMGTTAGLQAAEPGKRTFVLSRAGFAGIQRYAANWLGDNQARWDHLWLSMPMAMGLGLSGQAFVGADIGGFQGPTNPELFLRWVQYGALTPFCRNHSEIGAVDQYAWSWGHVVRDIARDAISLRYRLLPYIYAAFARAAETGAPVQRPLVFDHQDDPLVRDLDDEYLFGDDLLVAPVVEAGTSSRRVYLPAGNWYDWHTGEQYTGRRFLEADTPLERIPLYARGGAVVPMWPQAPATTAGHHPEVVELHVFVPAVDGSHESLLVEDDGLTADGAQLRTVLTLTRSGDRLALRAETTGERHAAFARTAFHVVLHGAGERAPIVVADAGDGFTEELDL